MTTLYCSNKLREFIGEKNFESTALLVKNPFGDWNAHLFNFDRKRHLIIINNKSYYAVVIHDIKKSQLKTLPTLFLDRLIEQLAFDQVISRQEIPIVCQKYTSLRLERTNNDRKALGTINDFLFHYTHHHFSASPNKLELLMANAGLNRHLTGAGRNASRLYGNPAEDMRNLLFMPLV